ncbi:MAG TPA: TIGR01212 family radical SAM protein [Bacteroidales bacterium]|nr:TIGR01212 family radical SAM protein [Bacteroidales bacterium]
MTISQQNSYPWGHHRRFNSYTEYFRKNFGERVQKVTIDAGFTCPNRDGTKGRGGCTYCNNDSFNPSYCQPYKGITKQIDEGVEFHANRYRRADKFLAYFQAYSNTYAPLEKLKAMYDEALAVPGIVGLVIGTRPDCIDDEKLDYFQALSEKYYVIIEYGLESCYNRTLDRINRCHTFEESVDAIERTAKRGIKTGAHFILGLLGESREDIINEIPLINSLPLNTIKFHQLLIVKNTAMAQEYAQNPERFNFFTIEEYIDFFIQMLEKLNPAFVIERFTSEVPPRFQAGPNWGMVRTNTLLQMLENRLEELNTWQGRLFV